MSTNSTWQDRLSELIKEKGYSRHSLSIAIGKDPSYLGKMQKSRNGKVGEPSWKVVQAICRVLEVSPSELMGNESGETSDAA